MFGENGGRFGDDLCIFLLHCNRLSDFSFDRTNAQIAKPPDDGPGRGRMGREFCVKSSRVDKVTAIKHAFFEYFFYVHESWGRIS